MNFVVSIELIGEVFSTTITCEGIYVKMTSLEKADVCDSREPLLGFGVVADQDWLDNPSFVVLPVWVWVVCWYTGNPVY